MYLQNKTQIQFFHNMFYAQFHHFFGQAGQLKTNFVLKSQGQQLIRGF